MKNLIVSRILPVAIMLCLIMSVSAVVSVSWGVEKGEIGIYWLEDVRISGGENFAPLLGDTNRTSLVIITDIGTDYLNYTLGLTNGTNNLVDQQILMEEVEFNDNLYFVPSGDLPFVLPLSAGDYGNYLQTLGSQAAVIGQVANQLISSNQNLSFVDDFSVNGLYTPSFLNISATATLNNVSDISNVFTSQVNMTDIDFVSENENITSVDLMLGAAYNTTDGMLSEVQLDSAINTLAQVDNSTQSNTYTFNATIVRKAFIPIRETVSSISSVSSSIAENSYFGLLTIPTLILLHRRRTH